MLALCLGVTTFTFAQNRATRPGANRATAQPQPQMDTPTQGADNDDMREDRYDNSAVRLDETQQRQMKEIRQRRQQEMNELEERYSEPLKEYRSEKEELNRRYDEEYRGMLTPEQQKAYDTNMSERKERMEQGKNLREKRMQDMQDRDR